MDPQQRLLLEVTWETLERAGHSPATLVGSDTGVFVGITFTDYHLRLIRNGLADVTAHHLTGNALNFAAGRLAFTLGLQGPCVAIDTACSSSLVAVHLAVQALQRRECRMAIAAGVNVMIEPEWTITACKAGMLSPDSRCKTFDAAANGYVRSEGCGVVLLKRLGEAVADRDHVVAVVRGTAVNQNGRSSGLTTPNPAAQTAVVRSAIARAGIRPSEVTYVEAHGTGTPLGDPIEVRALAEALSEGRTRPLLIGSAKTNVGHLESAAGMAGFIKTALSLEFGELPPHLNLTTPNPNIEWESLPVEVVRERRHWPEGAPRVAGVSSFGGSGTNAHAVLTAADPVPRVSSPSVRPLHVLCLSARSDSALRALVVRYAEHFRRHIDIPIADACFTASVGRSHFSHRLAIVVADLTEAQRKLEAFASGCEDGVVRGIAPIGRPARVAFLFTGQGAQRVNMGRELFDTEPTFADALASSNRIVSGLMPAPLLATLYPLAEGASPIDETAFAQPALVAFEWAMASVWQNWGIRPSAVLGHSVGELAAACVSGAVSIENALRLAAARGRLMQALPRDGAMIAVSATERDAWEAIGPRAVSIAAVNGQRAVVLSGRRGDVEEVAAALSVGGAKSTRLRVSHAFHSACMDPMLDAFEVEVEQIGFDEPEIPFVSNLTGACVTRVDASYWKRHVREPVRFADGLRALLALDVDVLLEVGPAPVLLGLARVTLDDGSCMTLPSLREGRSDWGQMLETLATLYVRGAEIDWERFAAPERSMRVPLPTYPFERERHWVGPRREPEPTSSGSLLARTVAFPLGGVLHETTLSASGLFREHRVYCEVVVPAAAYIAMALEASMRATQRTMPALESIEFITALRIPDSTCVDVQLLLEGNQLAAFRVFSTGAPSGPASQWTEHARGRVVWSEATVPSCPAPAVDVGEEHAGDAFYAFLSSRSVDLGPSFRWVEHVHATKRQIHATLQRPRSLQPTDTGLHPGLIDSCFQLMMLAVPEEETLYVPVHIERLVAVASANETFQCHIALRDRQRDDLLIADLTLFGEDGKVVLAANGVHLKRAARVALLDVKHTSLDECLYRIEWHPWAAGAASRAEAAGDRWWILGAGLVALAEAMRCRGVRCGMSSANDFALELGSDELKNRGPLSIVWVPEAGHDEPEEAAPGQRACEEAIAVVRSILGLAPGCSVRLFVVTRGAEWVAGDGAPVPRNASLTGVAATLRAEHPELRCTLVDVDPANEDVDVLADVLVHAGDETRFVVRGGVIRVARLVRAMRRADDEPLSLPESAEMRLDFRSRGAIDHLRLVPQPRRAPDRGEVSIKVDAVGINFRDVLNVLGMYPGDAGALGAECAGRVAAVGAGVDDLASGDSVVAACELGIAASHVTIPASRVVRAPPRVALTVAAGAPIAFLTARYGLEHLARVRAGDRVLVHAAAGAVGLAAIQVGRALGAEVLATASRPKWDLVRSMGVAHIFDSRSLPVADAVRAVTEGRGVDVILGSLAGEMLLRSFDLLAPGGRILQIGKQGNLTKELASRIRPDVEYHAYDLIELARREPEEMRALLDMTMRDIDTGRLLPLPTRVVSVRDAPSIFRSMAQGKHTGKLVLGFTGRRTDRVHNDGTYLITGGTRGLGLCVADHLVRRGARHLALVSRSGTNDTAMQRMEAWRARGVNVIVESVDVARESALAAFVTAVRRAGPPIAGIVHAAGVIDDAIVLHQTRERIANAFAAKVAGAWNLHRTLHTETLDFFLLFSSISASLGTAGQVNYAAANASLSALAHHRRALGQCATVIEWGPWLQTGMAARTNVRDRDRLRASGVRGFEVVRGLSVLDRILERDLSHVIAADVEWEQYIAPDTEGVPRWLSEVALAKPEASEDVARGPRVDLVTRLREAPRATAGEVLREALAGQLAHTLGLGDLAQLDAARPLREQGLDSLMAIEFRNRIAREIGRGFPPTLLFDYPSLDTLVEFLENELLGPADDSSEDGRVDDLLRLLQDIDRSAP